MKHTTPGLTPENLFARETLWQSWLDVEAALAEAQAEIGMIPDWAAKGICAAATLDRIGIQAMEASIAETMAPILSLTRLLSREAGTAGAYVHWGATTQNVMQTSRILLMREAHTAIRRWLGESLIRLAALAEAHADTLMVGRTNRQHALPITFGFKVAGWIEEITRAADRLQDSSARLFVLPFGGAVGAMHAFGPEGQKLTERLARRFGLGDLLVPGRAINDLFAEYVVQLSLLGMTIERVAAESYLLMTQEIGELSETLEPGVVGSSTMPHKVNPKFVVRVMAQASELRGMAASALSTGLSSHEGDSATNQLLSSVLDRAVPLAWTLAEGFDGLIGRIAVHPQRMAENAELSGGSIATENLMMRLATRIGRAEAHDLLHHALEHRSPGETARDALVAHPTVRQHMPPEQIAAALDPAAYCGDSARIARDAAKLARERARSLGAQIR